MKLFTILKNIITRFKQGISQCLADAKDYADAGLATKLTTADLKLGTVNVTASVSGSSTAWASAAVPSGRKLIAIAGFYWSGNNNTNCTPYAFRQTDDKTIQVAIKNWSGSSASLSIDLNYIYIDVGGVILNLLNRRVVFA